MRPIIKTALNIALLAAAATITAAHANSTDPRIVELGPRPYYLVDKMNEGSLKDALSQCAQTKRNFRPTLFSIGHRGAPLQFPEHTKESYEAGARMGAGILECDVTFTSDEELVCRHAQCDLHTTTNILATPLAEQCTQPFAPAEFNSDGTLARPATAKCCTSDITLAEFKTLKGKMDAANTRARNVAEYLGGTAPFRTDLYTTGGTLLTHAESIELFQRLRVGMTPELKAPEVPMPFNGTFSQEDYAQKMIDEYKAAGVSPRRVWAQSFDVNDVLYWVRNEPQFGRQAVFLDGTATDQVFTPEQFAAFRADGIRIIAPPMPKLLTTNAANEMIPSEYALRATAAGLKIISWTTERSGRIVEDVLNGGQGFYYSTVFPALDTDGDILETIDVLAQDVGIIGLFSDWPATTSFYANCMNLK